MKNRNPQATSYHAHIYYNADTYNLASELCDKIAQTFEVSVGHKHKQAVGPHPMWSCQVALTPEQFAHVVPWLMMNRQGLTVLVHPNTGDNLKDHTDHTLWMGTIEPLDLSIFS
jgi:DOPA 4,5-dioxygenase